MPALSSTNAYFIYPLYWSYCQEQMQMMLNCEDPFVLWHTKQLPQYWCHDKMGVIFSAKVFVKQRPRNDVLGEFIYNNSSTDTIHQQTQFVYRTISWIYREIALWSYFSFGAPYWEQLSTITTTIVPFSIQNYITNIFPKLCFIL